MPVTGSTRLLRALSVAGLAVLFAAQTTVDSALQHVWDLLREHWAFRHDSFEPVLATLSFFPFLALWCAVDLWLPSLHCFRVQPKNNDVSHWKVVANLSSGNSHMPVMFFYIAPLLALDMIYPRRMLPEQAPSVLRLLGEIVGMLLVYDALFYVCHRTMHHPWVYRAVHVKHHLKHVTRANDAVRLTITEEFFDVGCSIVAVNVVKAHPLLRAVYNVVIVYLLIELHCGYDFPFMLHNIVPGQLMGGPARHDAHHSDGRFYYQKFFTYLDNMLGTAPPTKARRHTTLDHHLPKSLHPTPTTEGGKRSSTEMGRAES
jgi:sterol desaturase/sphingolipid hydroxylase (fatty acid hydroxylase superfamily)